MNETFATVLGLLGGLAIFIYGMNLMSESLQKVAGDRMRSVLALLTKNPIMGVLAGALTTAVLQSSSATTVMAIGFVGARLMGLPQAISIILGANIGTTITAQIIAFKITDYILLFVFVGFLISFVAKKERTKFIGRTIFAFGLLFLGIDTMGDAMKPLASSQVFVDLIGQVADIPVLGVLVGTLMTLLVQSSSATIAVLQNFASQPAADGVSSIIGLEGALPILLGDNIGTTITALMAAVGQSRNAKRVALSHCLFNVSGALIFIWLITPFAAFVSMISPAGPEVEVISRQIANAHTCFNIIMTCIWLPLIALMVKIVMKIIPDNKKSDRTVTENIERLMRPLYLDKKMTATPAATLQLIVQEVVRCGDIVRVTVSETAKAAHGTDEENAAYIKERVEATSTLCRAILDVVTDLFASGGLTEAQVDQTAGIIRIVNEQQRISVQCGELIELLQADYSDYSEAATRSMQEALGVMDEMYVASSRALRKGGEKYVDEVLEKRNTILELDMRMRREHMKRVAAGECEEGHKSSFVAMLNEIDRVTSGCVSIAETVATGRIDLQFFVSPEDIQGARETMYSGLKA